MTETAHPDEIQRLRLALWGERADPGGGTALHVARCAACAADVAFHRRLRDAFRRRAAAAVPPESMAIARAAAAGADSSAGTAEPDWLPAVPVVAEAGVRSAATADLHVTRDLGGLSLDVVLFRGGRPGSFAISGQALRRDAAPAAGVEVTLFVDRRCAAASSADAFGEFAFGLVCGATLGLCVGRGAESVYVDLLPAGGRR